MRKSTPRQPRARSSSSAVRTNWELDDPGLHPAVESMRHFFSRDSLASALDVAVYRGDPFLFAGPGGEASTGGISAMSGVLVAENSYSIEVAIRFRAPKRHLPNLRVVVARNGEDLSQMLRAEAKNLTALAPRLKTALPTMLRTGTLLLPERNQAKKVQSRRISAYATTSVHDSVYGGVGQRDQMRVYTASPRLLSVDATDDVKRNVIELCLRSFDPRTHTAMPPPDLVRGAMRLSTREPGRARVVLCGCPFLWDHIDPVALLHRLTGFDWKEGNKQMPLLPTDQALLGEAMIAALGEAPARAWAKDYVAALGSGRYKPHHRFSLADAKQLHEMLNH